jgi:DNA primase
MITVWDKPVLASINDIVKELRNEIRAEGVELMRDMKPTHRNIMITCPFHGEGKEKKPSFGISTTETKEGKRVYPAGTCHCFTCGYSAELPEFVSNVLGYQDKGMNGYKWITSRFASVTVEQRRPLALDMSRSKEKDQLTYITEEELESYRYSHPYMYFRKLNDKVIEYFDVGYDQATDSLTFPVHDLTGGVVFVQRRAIGKKQFMNESIAAKGQVVYGLYHVYKNLSWIKEVVICESIIDALTCWVYRVPAVATLGALPTTKQIELLNKVPVRKFITGLDNPLIDKAGKDGSIRLAEQLGKTKLINYLKFPEGVKDINEMTEEQFLNREVTAQRYFQGGDS